MIPNLFDLSNIPRPLAGEIFKTLIATPGVRIEKIVSMGHTTPDGEWYDQTTSEWVLLLQGQADLTYDDGRIERLVAGDSCWIPAHTRHRVTYTSTEPACIWVAVHVGP